MADYASALNTTLGDYLSLVASKKGISRQELEMRIEIDSIKADHLSVFMDPSDGAIKKFDNLAKNYDVVIELREGLSEIGLFGPLGSSYRISGTGIKNIQT